MNFLTSDPRYLILGIEILIILLIVGFKGFQTWKTLQPNFIRLLILTDSNTIRRVNTTLDSSGIATVGNVSYKVEPSTTYKTGIFHVPVAIYYAGETVPIDLKSKTRTSVYNPKELNAAIRSKVVRDFIASLSEDVLSPTMQFILIIVAVLATGALVWYDLSKKIAEIGVS
jgi:hypothetical protein